MAQRLMNTIYTSMVTNRTSPIYTWPTHTPLVDSESSGKKVPETNSPSSDWQWEWYFGCSKALTTLSHAANTIPHNQLLCMHLGTFSFPFNGFLLHLLLLGLSSLHQHTTSHEKQIRSPVFRRLTWARPSSSLDIRLFFSPPTRSLGTRLSGT